jgi:hypothetical protein
LRDWGGGVACRSGGVGGRANGVGSGAGAGGYAGANGWSRRSRAIRLCGRVYVCVRESV